MTETQAPPKSAQLGADPERTATRSQNLRWRDRVSPALVLSIVLVCFSLLACAVLSLTAPWEANDEPAHVQNIETLASGHWYRIGPSAGLESHQAPLYYLILAGYQKLLRLKVEPPDGVLGPSAFGTHHGNYVHNVPQDGTDQRRLDLLRLPSVAFGLMTIIFTFLAARWISRDRWTPVVAAAVVAAVPRFVFLSGVVNNDNLSDALGGAALAAAVALLCAPPSRPRRRVAAAAGLGVLAGALVLTKLTAALVAPGLLLAVLVVATGRREALRLGSVFVVFALVVCGWWLVQNQMRYGDPLAAHASEQNFKALVPSILTVGSPFHAAFVNIPKVFYSSFWYDSGWNQFRWTWFWYLPFWILTAVGIWGLARRSRIPRPGGRAVVWTCSLIALGGVAIVWVLGLQTTTEQGRLGFVGLPAIAVLIALGYERLRMPPALRFVLPAIGLVGTILAIRSDVIIPFS